MEDPKSNLLILRQLFSYGYLQEQLVASALKLRNRISGPMDYDIGRHFHLKDARVIIELLRVLHLLVCFADPYDLSILHLESATFVYLLVQVGGLGRNLS